MPFIQASGTGGGGSGSISVTDGVTTVNPATIVDFTSGATVSNAGGGQANVAISAGSFSFSPTAAKVANYTAAASEWVAVDPSGGNFTVTLPAAPANGTIVAVGHVAASGTVTVAAGAGDTIGGGLQTSISTTRRAFIYTYRASDKVWQGETPLSAAVLTATAFDGSIVTGGTSTAVTLKTGTLDAVATAQPPVASVNLNSQKLVSVLDPTAAQDAATKNYVDSVAAGLDFKQACDLATTGALAANTYANGALGVGATLTANGFGALSVDGTAVTVGQRILVKNEATQSHNGIYVVTATGGGAALYILTRATDYNQTSEIQAGDAVFVTAGSTLADTLWVMTTTGAITVGTTAIVFSQFGNTPNLAAVLAVGNTASAKIVSLTNGSAAADAAAYGQIPAGGGQALIDFQRYTANATWTKPTNATFVRVICIGSGGGGGGANNNNSGGGGGGGGSVTQADFRASDLTATVAVTVDAGGAGGTGGATGAAGTNGAATTFGAFARSGGGGGGGGSSAAAIAGGGGGSVVNTAATTTAGSPGAATPIGGQGANNGGTGNNGVSSEWGGASGGGSNTGANAGRQGGSAIFGGPGGGSGFSSAGGAANNGGGTTQSYAAGGGGAAGTNGASPSAGGNGTTFVGPYCGAGGGGGGGASGGNTGGAGGTGGIGAGGGGGGASASGGGGAGGQGGTGLCIVVTW